MPPGKTIVIRDTAGLIVFGWLFQEYRDDGQRGFNCCIFRNTSERRSSDVILECEEIALDLWGENRMFTYVDPAKIASSNPGYCFKRAGWHFLTETKSGLHLLAKEKL